MEDVFFSNTSTANFLSRDACKAFGIISKGFPFVQLHSVKGGGNGCAGQNALKVNGSGGQKAIKSNGNLAAGQNAIKVKGTGGQKAIKSNGNVAAG